MDNCEHTAIEMEIAGDGICPICRQIEIERLRGLSHMNAKTWDAMVAERDRLRAALFEITCSDESRSYDIARKALDHDLPNENARLRTVLKDLLECAEAECVSGSSHEPIENAKIILNG